MPENPLQNEGMKILSEALKSMKSLTTLKLTKIKLSSIGLLYLGEALKSDDFNPQVMFLNDNEIDDEGVKYLSEGLRNKSFTKLYLFKNNISDKGCEYLSAEGVISSDLLVLSLDSNQISGLGVATLCEKLNIPKVEEVYFYNNRIELDGIYAISKALPNWKNLTLLNLSDCGIDDISIDILLEAVDKDTLKKLFLHNNQISHDKIVSLLNYVLSTKLIELSIFGNDFVGNCQEIIDLKLSLKIERPDLTIYYTPHKDIFWA
eukprot:TRINITY_DN549_c0_g1_i4.p1 TRINITY_DN549_c0_g1~~TRINITY_DN549_c0_g1_i4.p1  ORF type:complete len:262 (+),score=28.54 TRINITY_DN549_c0_g1_i4:410-1195(+)